MKIKHISYTNTDLYVSLNLINNYIEENEIKKEDILKFDYSEGKDVIRGHYWKIHLFYYAD